METQNTSSIKSNLTELRGVLVIGADGKALTTSGIASEQKLADDIISGWKEARRHSRRIFSIPRPDGTSVVVEQWFDEGGITGGAFSVRGFPADTGKFLELDQGYAFEAPAGSGDFSIVANPTSTSSDCANEQGIQTFGPNDKPRYLRALIDACSISDDAGESTVIGYGSDLGRVEIKGDVDGNYFMTYSDPAVQLDGTPAEVLSNGGSVAYRAPLADGSVLVSMQDSFLRGCTSADLG